ncbi:unnamed protein product, partial [Closterium sp. Yama58-4]
MAPSDELEALRQAVVAKQEEVTTQGDTVRALKAAKADRAEIDAAIEKLKHLKLDLESATKAFTAKSEAEGGGKGKDASINREAFRQAVNNALERRLFIIPSFKIYGGVAGLFDYGPPGCAVKSNVLAFWRQHFVLEENMLEVDCPCVTPDAVLRASGHVDKFTDLMVKDVKTQACYRADHLLKDHLGELLEKEVTIAPERREEIKHVLAVLDEYGAEELDGKLKEFGVKAPDTKNDLSAPYPFNLMFSTAIGPTGLLHGYLRPETAQGIFVNFKDLLYYNGGKLPFAAAQIGQAFRNEIAPRAGLLRVREFTLAEIEHFVSPTDKSHPRFPSVADLSFLLYPRAEQLGPKQPVTMRLGDAVEKGIINNETLGYFIGRTFLFLSRLGIDPQRLRFRQHLQHEMAHYATDCWDAEIECSYGWVECVGLADRSAFDLKAHTEKSKVELVAYEKFPEPREVEVMSIVPSKKDIGKAFKRDAKLIAESLEAMTEAEALAMKAALEAEGKVEYTPCGGTQAFSLTKEMVAISKEKKKLQGQSFTPSVIEPSFGIGRIIYCIYEHSFYSRPSADEARTVFRFTPLVAPIKCTVFPLVQRGDLEKVAQEASAGLTKAGVANKIDTTGTTIGKRYARTDELGCPFAITVDGQTLEDGTVTLRERDSTAQVRIHKDEVASVVRQLADGLLGSRLKDSTRLVDIPGLLQPGSATSASASAATPRAPSVRAGSSIPMNGSSHGAAHAPASDSKPCGSESAPADAFLVLMSFQRKEKRQMGPVLSSQSGGTPRRAAAAMTLDGAHGTGTAIGSPRIPDPIPFSPSAHPPSHCVVPSSQRFPPKERAQISAAAIRRGCAVDVVEQRISSNPPELAAPRTDGGAKQNESAEVDNGSQALEDFVSPGRRGGKAAVAGGGKGRGDGGALVVVVGMWDPSRPPEQQIKRGGMLLQVPTVPHFPPGTQQRTPRRSAVKLADKRRAAFHSALTAALHRTHQDFLDHVLPPAPQSQPAAAHIHPSPQSRRSAFPVAAASGMGCASRGLQGEESQHGAAGAAEGGSEAEQGEQECSAVPGEERMVEEGRFEAGGVDVEESGRVRGGKEKKQGCTGVKQSAGSMAWHADFPFEDISVSMLLAEAASFHSSQHIDAHVHARHGGVKKGGKAKQQREARAGRQSKQRRKGGAAGDESVKTGEVEEGAMESGEGAEEGGKKGGCDGGAGCGGDEWWEEAGVGSQRYTPPCPPRQLKKVPPCNNSPSVSPFPSHSCFSLPSPVTPLSAHIPPASPSLCCAGHQSTEPMGAPQLLEHLKQGLGSLGQVVHCEELPQRKPRYGKLASQLCPATWHALARAGVSQLYSHQ